MTVRIRCQVVEVPAHDDWRPGRDGRARDLLPWADPYIARLLGSLHEKYADDNKLDPFQADEDDFRPAEFDDGWREDAFMPRPLEPTRSHLRLARSSAKWAVSEKVINVPRSGELFSSPNG
jgi:hypothetical protein